MVIDKKADASDGHAGSILMGSPQRPQDSSKVRHRVDMIGMFCSH